MKQESLLNVLIVGNGMFVCGLGTDGYGTILPTLFEGYKQNLVEKITIVGRNPHHKNKVLAKVKSLNQIMGLNVPVDYFPDGVDIDDNAYQRLIKTGNFNCAIVSVPDHLHFTITKYIIESNLHCLVVKPLVPSIAEADTLIKLQEKHQVYCAVEFHKRFDEANLKIKKMLKEDKIGEILYILVEYSQRKTIPLEHFKSWSNQTNIFQYLGVHYADLIYFCTEAIPQKVLATGQKSFLINQGINTYDSIQVMIEWSYKNKPQKFTSIIATNWIDSYKTTAMSDQKIKYIGTLGRIESDQKNRGLHLTSDQQPIEDFNPYFSDFSYDVENNVQKFRGYGYKSILQFLKDCCNVINNQEEIKNLKGLRATFQEAKISTAIIEAANVSLSENGSWVKIDQNQLI